MQPQQGGVAVDVSASEIAPAAHQPGARLEDTVFSIVWQRLSVLVSLLIIQSLSQFILENYEGLIAANVIIPLFLTMLVGAGGNAGNQAAVRSITGLVTGEFRAAHFWQCMRKECVIGGICAFTVFLIGSMRVHYFYANDDDITTGVFETVFSISVSLFFIVFTSVVMGAALPFLFLRIGINVEHAAPVIQVLMDILGVSITCFVCSLFLPNAPPPSSSPTTTNPKP